MNAFTRAREENVESGTMTKGKVDTPAVATLPAPTASPAQSAAAPGAPDNLHRFDISYMLGTVEVEKTFNVQSGGENLTAFSAFLDDMGIVWKDTPIRISNLEILQQGLEFAVPPQTKGNNAKAGKLVATKERPDNGKRSVEGRKAARRSVRKSGVSGRSGNNHTPPELTGLESKTGDD